MVINKTAITVHYYLLTQAIKLKIKIPYFEKSIFSNSASRPMKCYFKVVHQTSESFVLVGLNVMLLCSTLTFVIQRAYAVGLLLTTLHPSTQVVGDH